ncbi:hypothetical protein SYNPS1DRAFT_24174 [Syncephalis pseudoplumigaleata]|uniref:Lysosomal dipeptide transporter MFSD1 n=1 Tax=Syncephalis pseudoplumigaleata TaxID=1712513 RepID=A0A4P9YWQ7_9FUNG|nr:hypothetical protein SYNPS1DRAFT_24174 [Syncephalis pseudoplumigaleata]|eukprot:RKP23751.1 hypothetical protein SYNPS1DRAFT_24174 [Syncephalis pseudoplumigaleata]
MSRREQASENTVATSHGDNVSGARDDVTAKDGTLKGQVKKELRISNSQYGVLQSSVAIVNTVLPLLAGLFVDTFGTQVGSILATSLIAAGYVLAATSTSLASFPLMVVGYVMYGLGSGSITVVQGAIRSHWFRGKGLAIAMGLEASYLSMATVVLISQWTGFYGWAFWVRGTAHALEH